jgi:hypothetical protein
LKSIFGCGYAALCSRRALWLMASVSIADKPRWAFLSSSASHV